MYGYEHNMYGVLQAPSNCYGYMNKGMCETDF